MEYTNFYEEFGSPLNPRKRKKLEEFLAKQDLRYDEQIEETADEKAEN